MAEEQKNNPLHGKTLEMVLNEMVAFYGWKQLGNLIPINCFTKDPSIKSSLKFLRTTPWARTQVEDLYVRMVTKPRGKKPGTSLPETKGMDD